MNRAYLSIILCIVLTACGGSGENGLPLSISYSPSHLTAMQFPGDNKVIGVVATVSGSVPNNAGTIYVVVTDNVGVINPNVSVTQNTDGTYYVVFKTNSSLAVGNHTGNISIQACGDQACTTKYGASYLPYDFNVIADNQTNLSPLSPWAGVGDWETYQKNPGHTGYISVSLSPSKFSTRWTWINPSDASATPSIPVTDSTNGTLFVLSRGSSDQSLYAIKERDGSVLWHADFGNPANSSLSDPSVSGNQVYVASNAPTTVGGIYTNTLYSYDELTGALIAQGSISSGSSYNGVPSQPVINGGVAYVNIGSQISASDAISGATMWTTNNSSWTFGSGGQYGTRDTAPAVDATSIYFFNPTSTSYNIFPYISNPGFIALDETSGNILLTISQPLQPAGSSIWSYDGSAPVIVDDSNVLVNLGGSGIGCGNSGEIDSYNSGSKGINWALGSLGLASYCGTPVVIGNTFYIGNVTPFQVEAHSTSDGRTLWTWTPPSSDGGYGFISNIVATNNLLFVSTDQQIYAIDLTSHMAVWSYPAAGSMSISASGLLYISRLIHEQNSNNIISSGRLDAINIH